MKDNLFGVGFNKMLTLSFITLLVIWLFMSLVLNQSYTSLLLNTYFNVKTTPVVKSLDDIREHKELLISGIIFYFKALIIEFGIDIQHLLTRLNQDNDNTKDVITAYSTAEKSGKFQINIHWQYISS